MLPFKEKRSLKSVLKYSLVFFFFLQGCKPRTRSKVFSILIFFIHLVVEVTQNWISRSAKLGPDLDNSVADFDWFSNLCIWQFSTPDWWKSAANSAKQHKNITFFFGLDLFQFYEGYFYYKYRPCIRVNLEREREREREGAKNKSLETNNKLRFREISLSGRH